MFVAPGHTHRALAAQVELVQIGAADAAPVDRHLDLARTDMRVGDVVDPVVSGTVGTSCLHAWVSVFVGCMTYPHPDRRSLATVAAGLHAASRRIPGAVDEHSTPRSGSATSTSGAIRYGRASSSRPPGTGSGTHTPTP